MMDQKKSEISSGVRQSTGVTGRLVLALTSSAMGMFNFGYNTGVINAPQSVIQGFFNETNLARGRSSSEADITLLWSFTVAITAVGGMLGGLLGAFWADKFGRKFGMMLNAPIGIVAAALMGFSKLATSYEMLIIGRLIVGFNCGLYTGLSPIYNAEIAPDKIRGGVGTLNQLAVTIGMLISQVLGLGEILGNSNLWPVLLGLTAAPPLIQLLTLPLVPESPRYLMLTKLERQKALEALMTLRGASSEMQVAEEFSDIESESMSAGSEPKMSFLQVLKAPNLRRPLLVAVVMHLSQQFSGINCIFYYSTTLFVSVGVAEATAKYATLAVGGIMVVMTLVSIPLMDRAGRRTLHLTGLMGMLIFSIAFTICFDVSSKQNLEWLKMVTIISALLIVVFFAIGPGSIPWMIVPELFAQGPRSVAVNIGVVVNWLSNFIVGQLFPILQKAMNTLVFIPFTVLLAIFFASLFFLLPETKGKTIEEITALFDERAPVNVKPDVEGHQNPGYKTAYPDTTISSTHL